MTTRDLAGGPPAHGLNDAELARTRQILGRDPNRLELGIFDVMWSEHCSYKSSRKHLGTFPTSGPRVLQGPGENAGVVDIGDGVAAVFKMESHNHPSFIEPYQGAATGVGGILRDIFTMGARPIASLNSLRFGSLDAARMRYLVGGVVGGIGAYGNSIGVPTLGGEVTFHPAYNGNILVNAFNLGIAAADRIFLGQAAGPGNPVIYAGSKTGRDGIHGATMASEEFDASSEQRRPTVQVGDPFTEKLLLEACLELFATDAVVGIQDMGAAGLTCSTFEMASRGGTGIDLDLDRVPRREDGMTADELMLSESQERMLIVAGEGRADEVIGIFRKWGLSAEVVGQVTDSGRVRVSEKGALVVDIPAHPLAEEAPLYDRPRIRPAGLDALVRLDLDGVSEPDDVATILRRLLASPNLCSRRWVWEQYDSSVRTNTVLGPGGDAAVVLLKGTRRGIALTTDCNPRFCGLDPYQGAALAVAEAARNIACVGGEPLAITDCLNFGNPEKPEIMWEFERAVAGMADACRHLATPVVSGNVSFYNETDGRAILPTPTVGMIGLLDDVHLHVTPWGFSAGDRVLLLGETRNEIGGSEYLSVIHQLERGLPPRLDLDAEGAAGRIVRDGIRARRITAAHDLSEGGLAVGLAECALPRPGLGLSIDLSSGGLRLDVLLFGESSGRFILGVAADDVAWIEREAGAAGLTVADLGEAGPGNLRIRVDGEMVIDEDVDGLRQLFESALPAAMSTSRPAGGR
ncbi:MAG: phosphoribosylformylglycinamidine synthase subunit PurL [Acidobacteriota bacterium]